MKNLRLSILLVAGAGACFGQQWEFGAVGGGSFLNNVNVSSPLGSATAGFQAGFAAGAIVGQSMTPHIAGEIRYEFLQSNLQISSGGSSAHFNGQAHAVHYDLILHTNRKHSPIQFFGAVGGGMKIFRGTGTEAAYQPLSQYGYLTKTQTVKAMGSVGGGVTFQLSPKLFMRTEFRDFITAFPKELITPAPNTKYGSLLHDFVPMVGMDYVF
jgi:hypothetical protein